MEKQHEERVRKLCEESEIGTQFIVERGFCPVGWITVRALDFGDLIEKVE